MSKRIGSSSHHGHKGHDSGHHGSSHGNGIHKVGTRGDDVLTGRNGNDRLDGGKGDDVLIGGKGNDRLDGGKGDDLLKGGKGNDRLIGGDGDDRLYGGRGNDRLDGGKGDDVLHGGKGNDRLEGGKGDDRLYGGKGNDRLEGGKGDDVLAGGAGCDRLDGGDGDDRLEGGSGNDHLIGGRGFDTAVYAGAAIDYRIVTNGCVTTVTDLNPADGDDGTDTLTGVESLSFNGVAFSLVAGTGGNDTVSGTAGSDLLLAGGGNDTINAGGGNDVVIWSPGDGNDRIDGGAGSDGVIVHLAGGAANTVNVTANPDGTVAVTGSGGTPFALQLDNIENLTIVGDDADDIFDIGDLTGTDIATSTVFVNGGGGDDLIKMPVLNWRLVADGGPGNDTIVGSQVADLLAGGTGDDLITGNGGDDEVDGGSGTDTFALGGQSGEYLVLRGAVTTITDLSPGDGDDGKDTLAGVEILRFADGDFFIDGRNNAPQAANDAVTTNEDTPVSGNVLSGASGGKDSDFDGDALAVATSGAFTTALGASVTLGADGAFTYDSRGSATLQALAAGASKVDSFDYTISDGRGGSDTATVSVTVTGLDAPGGSGSGKLLDSVGPGAVLDYFIRFEGTGIGPEWLQLDAFSLGLAQSGTLGGGGGGGAGKVTASDVSLLLGSSGTVVELTNALASGAHLKSVEIEAYRPGGDGGQLVDEYRFDDVLMTGLSTSAGSATVEQLSFAYGKISYGHVDYDEKGAKAGAEATGWDFAENKATPGVLPVPNAESGKLGESVPSGVELDYYVLFDGAPGWLRLDAFSMGITQSGTIGGGGGGGAGKATASDVSLLLGSSLELVDLTEALAAGKHLKNVEVEAYRPGAEKALVDQYYFEDVLFSSLNAGTGGANHLSFDYERFNHGHLEYDEKGAKAGETEGGWDFALNKSFSGGPATVGNVDSGKLLDSVGPGAVLDYFIRFEGTGIGPEWLQLDAFSLGLAQSGTLGGGGGGGAGKVTASDVSLLLGSSGTVVELTNALASGAHLKSVEIEAYRPGGDGGQLVDEYRFDDVLMTGLSTSAGSATVEQLSFAYGKISYGHVDYDEKGAKAGAEATGWDFAENKATPGVLPVPNAESGKLGESVPSGVELDYYVLFDGAPGWLRLDAFSMGITQSGTIGGGGGGGAGKATASDVSLLLGSSLELVDLTEALAAGKHLKNVEVEAYRPGAEKALVDQYYFEDVLFSSLNAGTGGANHLSFDYERFNHGHLEYDEKGAKAGETEGGWDFALNKSFSGGPATVGNVDSGKLLDSVGPGAVLDYFIRFEGTGIGPEWLQLDAFSLGLAQSGTLGGGGGGGAGKVTASDVSLLLGSSGTVVELTNALASGAHLKSVEIEAYRPGGDGGQLVDEYRFDDVLMTGLSTSAGSATVEQLSFAYGKISYGHVDYDEKGAKAGAEATGWDFAENKATPGVLPVPNAESGKLGESVPSGVELDYYVLFDGAPGWLRLDAFSMGITQSGTIGGGGGGGAGKATASDVSLLLGSSLELVDLTEALAAGKHLKNVEVEAYRPGAEKALVDQYYFEDVLFSSLNAGTGGANHLSFDYERFNHGHLEYDEKGAKAGETEGGWDFALNKSFSGGPAISPDIDFLL